jgi:hypothetical protein
MLSARIINLISKGMSIYAVDPQIVLINVTSFMAMTGVGVGLSASSLALQARFSVAEERNAVVVALTLFVSNKSFQLLSFSTSYGFAGQTRTLGGTVGLAQCGAILNAKVTSAITAAVRSGAISWSDAQKFSSVGIDSLSVINSLSPSSQALVRGAFRDGVKWSFYSLIPWYALSFVTTICLRKIPDSDKRDPVCPGYPAIDGTKALPKELESRRETVE